MDKPDIAGSRRPYRGDMRWAALFTDMELQLDALERSDREQAVADITRAERASVALADRLRACEAGDVRLVLRDGRALAGTVLDVGPVWLLLAEHGREHLVPFAAVATVAGLGPAAPPETGVLSRLGLGHALRAVARDRAVVRVLTTAGETVGRIDAVGADHVDVALVRPDSGRPSGEVRTVALAALVLVTAL